MSFVNSRNETIPEYKYIIKNILNGVEWSVIPAMSISNTVLAMLTCITMILGKLHDAISASFLMLAGVELIYSLAVFVMSILYIILSFSLSSLDIFNTPVPMRFVFFVQVMLFDMSTLLTAFVSTQKCLLVILPFRVKDMFSATKSVITCLSICLAVSLWYLSVWLSITPVQLWNPFTNSTSVIVGWRDIVPTAVHKVSRIITGTGLPVVTNVVVFVDMILLTVVLKRSMRFRQVRSVDPISTSNKASSLASRSQKRLIKCVIVVCIVFNISNLPEMALLILKEVVEGFTFDTLQYQALEVPARLGHHFNCLMTFFTLYFYNSKFKVAFLSLFERCRRSVPASMRAISQTGSLYDSHDI